MGEQVDRLGTLKSDAEGGVDYCYRRAPQWAIIYYLTRGSLLLFSALTSAQALEALTFLSGAQPIFALMVTVIAGFDAWLKPSDKYRALYIANDEYNQLRQELEFVDEGDKSAIDAKLAEYKQIAQRLQKIVVP
jgi:hypothetical protein